MNDAISCARVPNLFLAGAPKCGTTALSHFLAGHPDLFMSEQAGYKEPGFYADDEKELFGMRPVKDRRAYSDIFSQAPRNAVWLGEASIIYLASSVAIPSILEDNSDARFIVAVRNPAAIARGLHNQRVREGSENILDFDEAWRLQGERLEGRHLPSNALCPSAFHYGRLASIGAQIQRMLDRVPREQVHFVVHEDLLADPLGVYKELLGFLQLEYDGRTDFEEKNAGEQIRSRSYVKALYGLNRLRRALKVPGLGTGLYRKMYRLGLKSGKADVDLGFEQELRRYFRSDVLLMQEILQRDFSHWLPEQEAVACQ